MNACVASMSSHHLSFRTTKAHLAARQEFAQLRQLRRTHMDVHSSPPLAEEETMWAPILTKQYEQQALDIERLDRDMLRLVRQDLIS
jgi:hypothetical protein